MIIKETFNQASDEQQISFFLNEAQHQAKQGGYANPELTNRVGPYWEKSRWYLFICRTEQMLQRYSASACQLSQLDTITNNKISAGELIEEYP